MKTKIIFSIAILLIAIVTVMEWRNRQPVSLPPLLAEVQCLNTPNDPKLAKFNSTLTKFDSYSLYGVCLDETVIKDKSLIGCPKGFSLGKPTCDDAIIQGQAFAHRNDDSITSRYKLIDVHLGNDRYDILSSTVVSISKQKIALRSYLIDSPIVHFNDAAYLDIPSKFTLEDAVTYHSRATNSTTVVVNLRFNDMYVQLVTVIQLKPKQKISDARISEEINFWLPLLDEMIVAP
ncbi:MAG: hypothetical protein CR974_03020 [Gammaproteobacteria bacterium]|nr:MAG: hypothetical protein CR974_03020 [Gammaproteobacteria bacterium]